MDKHEEERCSQLPEIHEIVGDFGRWQKQIYAIFFLICILNAWQNMNITFLAPNVDFHCTSPCMPEIGAANLNDSNFEKCSISSDQCAIESAYENITILCSQWNFTLFPHQRTIVSDWNLVCDREWLVSFSKSIYMIGYMISIPLMSQISDWFGRFPVIILSYVIMTISGLLSAASSSYAIFAFLRFLSGFGKVGVTTCGFVLLMEIVGPNKRTELGFGLQIGWSIGYMILPGIAWFVLDWVYLQLIISLPMLLLFIIYWIVPESPRWLLTQHKWDKFDILIEKAANQNKHIIDVNMKEKMKEYQSLNKEIAVEKKSIIDVMKIPELRLRVLALFIIWIVNSFIYYELSFNTNDLAGNFYLNFFLSGLVEIPGVLLFTYLVKRIGRKKPLFFGMIISGIFCGFNVFVPENLSWLTILFSMIAKFCITGTYQTVYLCTAELFPTVVRNATLGYCSTFARLGPILAPFVRDLGKATHKYVPDVLNATVQLAAGFLVLSLPETKDKRIQDKFETKEISTSIAITKNNEYSKLENNVANGIN